MAAKTGKRYTRQEMLTKVRQAEHMAAQGKVQKDIAKTLGVSVMTLHRWRKEGAGASEASEPSHPPVRKPQAAPPARTEMDIRELQDENLRLRQLVTDLLLEKLKLQEQLRGVPGRKRI